MSETTIKRLAQGLALALLLWGALALVRTAREDRVSRFSLPRVDTGAVDTVSIVRPGDSALLARGARGAWSMNGHPADTARVHELLRALADTTVRGELVAESRASHGRLGVDADSGRRLRVAGHGKTLLELMVGSRTSEYGGVHVRRGKEDAVYALQGNGVADAFTRSADDWRDKHIARIPPESVTSVEMRRGGNSTRLTREGAHWSLSGGGATDSSAVASLLDAYHDLSASGFPTKAQLDSVHLDRPRESATLRSHAGVLLSLVFDSTTSGVWARADAGGTVFRLDPWQLGRLTPPESTLKAKVKKK